MKRNNMGFTLVEIIASMAILALIMVIAVPGIGLISNNVKQNTYENKKSYLVMKAESWASETGLLATNVEHLIREGEAEADNESEDILNPMNNESMLCDVIRLDEKDGTYKGSYTTEKVCDYDELSKNNSIIKLVAMHENGNAITDVTKGWSKGNVLLKAMFKDGYESYKDYVTNITFEGNNQKEEYAVNHNFESKNSLLVSANQLLNQEYRVLVTILKDGKTNTYTATSPVKIDKQRPIFYDEEIKVEQNDVWTNTSKNLKFTISDGSGSGIYGYAVSSNPNCPILSYTKTKKNQINIPLNAGTYYLCAKDYAGNFSEDVSTKKVVVEKIDKVAPSIQNFSIRSNRNDYNNFDTILSITSSDISTMKMYVSNTDFQQNGSWENYQTSKNWNVGSSLDGSTKTVYLSLKDEAGNITNQKINYQIYSECTNKTIEYTSGFGSCSKSCGGGIQTRSYVYKDNITKKQCGSIETDAQSCNTFGCCSKTQISYYGDYGACSASCGNGLKYRTVYYKSSYDGSSCGTSSESTSCYLKSCTEYRYQKKEKATENKKITNSVAKTFYNCVCSGGIPIYTDGGITIEGSYGYYYTKPATSCNPPKTLIGYTNGKCKSYMELPYGGKFCISYEQIPNYIKNSPVCEKEKYNFCDSGKLEYINENPKCVETYYTCPLSMTLSGTMCFGAWSSWSSTPVSPDENTNVETRVP